MSGAISNPETIGALAAFLTYGPTGLAGLMFLLVVAVLLTRDIGPTMAGLLKLFMVIGALCFLAALAAQFFARGGDYEMRLTVAPNDLGSTQAFPPPIIEVNGQRISRDKPYIVNAATTILVDVTDALGAYQRSEQVVAERTTELNGVQEQLVVATARADTAEATVLQQTAVLNEVTAQTAALEANLARITTGANAPTRPIWLDGAIGNATGNISTINRAIGTITP